MIGVNHKLVPVSGKVIAETPDFFKSKTVRFYWEIDTNNKMTIYAMLIQAAALGIDKERIEELKQLWVLTDEDFYDFLKFTKTEICEKESIFYAHFTWYDDHNDIIIGNGQTPWEAVVDLLKKEWKNSVNFRYEDGNFIC
jgi:hypothetical protein